MNSTIRYLSYYDVRKFLSMLQTIDAMREAFRLLSSGEVVGSPRRHHDIPKQQGVEMVMPGYIPLLFKSVGNATQEIVAA